MIRWDVETNLIVRLEGDGSLGFGDACAETFRYFHLLMTRISLGISNEGLTHDSIEAMSDALQSVTSSDKTHLQRAPTHKLPIEWGDPRKDFPSDQTIPVIMALGARNLVTKVLEIKKNLGWFWQNGQPILPDGWACIRRASGKSSNIFYDMFIWGTVLARTGWVPTWDVGLKKLRWGDPNDCADDINLAHTFFQCEMKQHTWMSLWAKKYYAKHRDIYGAFATYYHDNPELLAIYQPVLQKVFYGNN